MNVNMICQIPHITFSYFCLTITTNYHIIYLLMKASILGSDGNILCQIPALRSGFESLGHSHTVDIENQDTSFIFVGNPPFEKFLNLEKKKIFNVLDIPWHVPEIREIVDRLRIQLPQATKVTTISHTVKEHLKDYVGVQAEVIYYPMKDIKFTGEKKHPYKALLCGRVRDFNKRAEIGINALIQAGYTEKDVAIVGGEDPQWGQYLGLVSDEVLNELYNSVDYVMMTSLVEGIGLPAIEGACAGAIPIVLPDMTTFEEFWAKSPLGENYRLLTTIPKVSEFIQYLDSNKDFKAQIKEDMLGYAELAFRPKFDKIEVAKRLIEVYDSI
jgi:hypothetical protein